MKRVLLKLDNPSSIVKKTMDQYPDEIPYAILLLDKNVSEQYTIEPKPEDIKRKTENQTICACDRVPITHFLYDQSCIVYDNKKERDENKGTYWDFLPEGVDEFLYEYTASLTEG